MLKEDQDFIANAAHELRAPITIIRGYAEALQEHPGLSQEMFSEITAKMIHTCDRMDRLIKSLLTLSNAENVSIEKLQPTDLFLVVENCKLLLLSAHPHARVFIKSNLKEAIIAAGRDLLELALLNLLENAVKYSEGSAEITIQIHQIEDKIHLKIADKGIGIASTDLPRIFDRFYSADKARCRKFGGTGLGLSIVKAIIEKHDGEIQVQSELGKGSVFIVAFPVG